MILLIIMRVSHSFWGVPVLRAVAFWGPCWGPPLLFPMAIERISLTQKYKNDNHHNKRSNDDHRHHHDQPVLLFLFGNAFTITRVARSTIATIVQQYEEGRGRMATLNPKSRGGCSLGLSSFLTGC